MTAKRKATPQATVEGAPKFKLGEKVWVMCNNAPVLIGIDSIMLDADGFFYRAKALISNTWVHECYFFASKEELVASL